MRLVDADALPRCWQPNCNGNRQFVDLKDIDAAPTISCEECAHSWQEDGIEYVYRPAHTCRDCACGSEFERRRP